MERKLEPELMDDPVQALAYADADFEVPHSTFVKLFQDTFRYDDVHGYVLDLGCGPGDVSFRFCRAYPQCIVHGIDGAEAMLGCGRDILNNSPDIRDRVELVYGILPGCEVPRKKYDIVISNSLLHHLTEPQVLWNAVKLYACHGASIFIMDLRRPATRDEAQALVDTYAVNEPEILRRDFYCSLLAAFEVDEIIAQLKDAKLHELQAKAIGDRHVTIAGYLV